MTLKKPINRTPEAQQAQFKKMNKIYLEALETHGLESPEAVEALVACGAYRAACGKAISLNFDVGAVDKVKA